MKRTLTEIRKVTPYFTLVAKFCKDEHDQGGVTYDRHLYEENKNGYLVPPSEQPCYRKFASSEQGIEEFREFLRNGFVVVSKETFEPTQMDMR